MPDFCKLRLGNILGIDDVFVTEERNSAGRQRKRLCVMTLNSSTSSLWQYVNDTMEQYGTLDLTGKPAVMAGVGLVLDTRSNDAKAVVKSIEREMAEIQGKADKACGEVRKQADSCAWHVPLYPPRRLTLLHQSLRRSCKKWELCRIQH